MTNNTLEQQQKLIQTLIAEVDPSVRFKIIQDNQSLIGDELLASLLANLLDGLTAESKMQYWHMLNIAFEISQSLGNMGATAKCELTKLLFHKQLGEHLEFESQITTARKYYQGYDGGYKDAIVFLGNLGEYFRAQSKSKLALDVHTIALDISTESRDKKWQVAILTSIGIDLHELRDFDRALDYHRKSIDIAREINDQEGEIRALHNIGNVYRVTGKFEQAAEIFLLVLKAHQENNNLLREFSTLALLKEVYKKQEKHDGVIYVYKSIIDHVNVLEKTGQDEALLRLMMPIFGKVIDPIIVLQYKRFWNDPTPANAWRVVLWKQILQDCDQAHEGSLFDVCVAYDELLEMLAPDSEDVHILQSLALFDAQRYDESIEYCERVLKGNPRNWEAWKQKGVVYLTLKKYRDAIDCFNKALVINPSDHEAWVKLGGCWMHLQNWEEMLKHDERAIEIEPKYIPAWHGKSIALMQLGQYNEAADCLQKCYELDPNPENESLLNSARELRQKSLKTPISSKNSILSNFGPAVEFTVRYYNERGLQAVTQGNYSEAVKLYETSIQICIEKDVKKEYLLEALANLGVSYMQMGNHDLSIECSQKALKIAAELDHKTDQERAIGNIGWAYLALGKYDEAEPALQQALEINKATKNESGNELNWINGLTTIHQQLGRTDSANLLIEQSTSKLTDRTDWEAVSMYFYQAKRLKDDGKLNDALLLASKCLEFAEYDADPHHRSFIYEQVGDLYMPVLGDVPVFNEKREHKNEYLNANRYYEKALQIADEINHVDSQIRLIRKIAWSHPGNAIKYAERGMLLTKNVNDLSQYAEFAAAAGIYYINERKPKEAESYCREALSMSKNNFELDKILRLNLGGICLCLGKFNEALKLTEKALELSKQSKDLRRELHCLGQLSQICLLLDETEIAVKYMTSGYKLMLSEASTPVTGMKSIGPILDFGEHFLSAVPIARSMMKNGDYLEAYSAFKDMIEVLENASHNVPAVKHRETILWKMKGYYWETLTAALEAGLHKESIELFELTKTRNLTSVIASRDVVAGKVPSNVLADYLSVTEKKKKLHEEIFSVSMQQKLLNDTNILVSSGKQHELDSLQTELISIAERIRAYDPKFFWQPEIGDPINYTEILKLSQQLNSAIVEIIVADTKTYVLIIDPATGQTHMDHVDWIKSDMESLTLSSEKEIDETTYQLWHKLIRKVVDLLSVVDTKRIVIIPSRVLNLLPLHAAWCENQGRREYLIDMFEISYSPSLSVLDQCAVRHATRQYDIESLTVIKPLFDTPFAEEEVRLIKQVFEGKFQKAIISSFELNTSPHDLPPSGLLHICSHGNEKGLFIQPNKDIEQTNNYEEHLMPGKQMTKSLYTAQEIERQDLSTVKIASLSACESGKTETGGFLGDEYIGLPSSFILSGVPTVIASLWKVSGISTGLLMWRFYSLLIEGAPASQALRESQLWLKAATKMDVLKVLDQIRLQWYQQGIDLPEDSLEYQEVRRNFWRVESGMRWVEQQSDQPFSKPYWWAGFQVVGWPGKM